MLGDDNPRGAREFHRAKDYVLERSEVFRKPLGLRDLVLTQILFVLGTTWVGTAGKLGPSHVTLWLLAVVLFYVPLAVVVIYLSKLMPLEGGLYQWAKLGLNESVGFMVAWNLWLFGVILMSTIGLQAATYLSYAIGPSAAWLAENKLFIAGASVVIIGTLAFISILGLGVGKWIHNAGSITAMITIAALIAAAPVGMWRGTPIGHEAFVIALPALSLFSLNILSKMSFGAFGGLEYVAIIAGECRAPERALSRSIMIAGPALAVMYILGTNSVLMYIRPDQIDLIAPIPQVLSLVFQSSWFIGYVITALIIGQLVVNIASASVSFTANTRLPMVTGWDCLLPIWFTRLHPLYRTPVNSIIFVAVLTLAIAVGSQIGVGHQEAFQLLINSTGVLYAIAYATMFAIPLVGLKGIRPRPSAVVRAASVLGLLMICIYITLSIFPIVSVQSRLIFAVKIISVAVTANSVGLLIFLLAIRRRKKLAGSGLN